MSQQFLVRAGKVTGRNHIFSDSNCQDAYEVASVEVDSEKYTFAVVSDGCGSGKYSEVGSSLCASFAVKVIEKSLKDNVPQSEIPKILYQKTLRWLSDILRVNRIKTVSESIDFIKDYLLFTLIGVVVGPKQTVIFAYGDGLVVVNNEIDFRDQKDAPRYVAYHLIPKEYLGLDPGEILPEHFDRYQIPTQKLTRLAIGTDAWKDEKDLILFNKIWGIDHPAGLQRKMNVWSGKEHRFSDDATLVIFERRPK